MLASGKWRPTTLREVRVAIVGAIEKNVEVLPVTLSESVKAHLQIVFGKIGVEADLAAGVGRRMLVGSRSRIVVRGAGIVRGSVMVEGRHSQQEFRIEGVNPGKIHDRIRFVIRIAQA